MNTIPHPEENKPKPPSTKLAPPPHGKAYISELKVQLELVKAKIAELEDRVSGGAFAPRFRHEDRATAKKLIDRRKELEDRIIFYDP